MSDDAFGGGGAQISALAMGRVTDLCVAALGSAIRSSVLVARRTRATLARRSPCNGCWGWRHRIAAQVGAPIRGPLRSDWTARNRTPPTSSWRRLREARCR